MEMNFSNEHKIVTIQEGDLIRKQVKLAPEENGDNLFWIVGRKLAAAELQLGRNLWTVVEDVLMFKCTINRTFDCANPEYGNTRCQFFLGVQRTLFWSN